MSKRNSLKDLVDKQHMELTTKLRNRFIIVELIANSGPQWAVQAIDPTHSDCWTHDLYMACYNHPVA